MIFYVIWYEWFNLTPFAPMSDFEIFQDNGQHMGSYIFVYACPIKHEFKLKSDDALSHHES